MAKKIEFSARKDRLLPDSRDDSAEPARPRSRPQRHSQSSTRPLGRGRGARGGDVAKPRGTRRRRGSGRGRRRRADEARAIRAQAASAGAAGDLT